MKVISSKGKENKRKPIHVATMLQPEGQSQIVPIKKASQSDDCEAFSWSG